MTRKAASALLGDSAATGFVVRIPKRQNDRRRSLSRSSGCSDCSAITEADASMQPNTSQDRAPFATHNAGCLTGESDLSEGSPLTPLIAAADVKIGEDVSKESCGSESASCVAAATARGDEPEMNESPEPEPQCQIGNVFPAQQEELQSESGISDSKVHLTEADPQQQQQQPVDDKIPAWTTDNACTSTGGVPNCSDTVPTAVEVSPADASSEELPPEKRRMTRKAASALLGDSAATGFVVRIPKRQNDRRRSLSRSSGCSDCSAITEADASMQPNTSQDRAPFATHNAGCLTGESDLSEGSPLTPLIAA
eukprot:284819460_2